MKNIKTLNEELNKHNFTIKVVDLESGNPTFYLFEIHKGSKTLTPSMVNIKKVIHTSSNEEQFLNYCQTVSIKLGHSGGRAL